MNETPSISHILEFYRKDSNGEWYLERVQRSSEQPKIEKEV